ncbi:PilN domain-containing protein [Pontibacillus sp. HMF3514]|uniref:PilN domain-containing protein n=1 Tax=Pontibacillus sp. HMF3514 TaxID=2692425 RepID=UPI00131F876C|nr:hypothetical protein [Pontibacillus sp. HMF3514]QHE53140.1 hypothetical protein GS400_14425 [Pontibacillus sp. HMF3514]
MTMIVEINLLEEKEKRNIVPFMIAFVGIFLLLATMIAIGLQKQAIEAKQEDFQREIQSIQKEQEGYKNILRDETQADRRQLQQAVDQVEESIFPSVSLLERMISLLPERGYFERYIYTKDNNLQLIVRFDSLQEVAAYTNTLLQEEAISNVELSNITTEQISEQYDPLEYRPRYIANYEVDIDEAQWKEEVDQDES